jgi:hypothetical protein
LLRRLASSRAIFVCQISMMIASFSRRRNP